MTHKFNITRYKFLLRKEENLKVKSEKLSDSDAAELKELKYDLDNEIYYSRKMEYFNFLENYLENKIDEYSLHSSVWSLTLENDRMTENLEKDLERLSDFVIHYKAKEFWELSYRIWEFLLWTIELDVFEKGKISQDDFRKEIEKFYHEMKTYIDD